MKKKKYIIPAGMAVMAAGITKIFNLVNHGSKYNLDYLHTVRQVTDKALRFEKDEDGFYSIINPDNRTLKILMLSDLHVGGGYLSRHEDRLVFKTINELAKKAKPDMIVLNGDLICSKPSVTFSRNNMNSMVQIVMLLESMGIPYAVTFGNKDATPYATHTREQLRRYLLKQNHCLMAWDGEDIDGKSNYIVKVRNAYGKITNVMYFLDSNSYVGYGRKNYDFVHDNQVKWYESQVQRLKDADGNRIPSIMFLHMPLPESRDIWNKAVSGDVKIKIIHGKADEQISKPKTESRLLDAVVNGKSTNAIFYGHDHLNNYSLNYKGIQFTCGKSLDYILYGKNITGHRGGTLIYLANNGEVRTKG